MQERFIAFAGFTLNVHTLFCTGKYRNINITTSIDLSCVQITEQNIADFLVFLRRMTGRLG